MKKDNGGYIGMAFAGHAFRAAGNEKKAAKYDNPLTDLVNIIIADAKAWSALIGTKRNDTTEKTETNPSGPDHFQISDHHVADDESGLVAGTVGREE